MAKLKPKKGTPLGKDKKKRSIKTIAYLRVSTIDQDLEKNKADILKLANDKNFGKVEFVKEKASKAPQALCLACQRPGPFGSPPLPYIAQSPSAPLSLQTVCLYMRHKVSIQHGTRRRTEDPPTESPGKRIVNSTLHQHPPRPSVPTSLLNPTLVCPCPRRLSW